MELQNNKDHECFFFVADWHALTTGYDQTDEIPENIRQMVIDWLAVGLDPKRATLFVQSHIKEHAELFLLLSMITPIGWLERNPTYKEMREELSGRDLSNFGFLGYPVLQASDIILYKGEGVPVGQDQVPHLELTREITRRFNHVYKPVFPEPKALLTPSPKLMGVDGRKMSKSYGNAILLSDSEKEIQSKVRGMLTDPKRARRQDPGDPDTCNFYPLHEIYSGREIIDQVRPGCKSAGIGCVDCKKFLLDPSSAFSQELATIRKNREEWAKSPEKVDEILFEGAKRARKIAEKVMAETRKAMNL